MTALLEAVPLRQELPPHSCELPREEIERRAYFRYLARGCVAGYDLEDWLAAEVEVRTELEAPSNAR